MKRLLWWVAPPVCALALIAVSLALAVTVWGEWRCGRNPMRAYIEARLGIVTATADLAPWPRVHITVREMPVFSIPTSD